MKAPEPERMYVSWMTNPYPYWLLRFRINGKIMHQQRFSVTHHGSKERAYEAAIAKRDQIAKKAGIDIEAHWNDCKVKKYRYTQVVGKRNTTGVPGVQYSVNGSCRYYKASICFTKYKETVKSFNCDKLGDKKAFKLAVAQRKAWEKQLKKKSPHDH